MYDAGIYCPDDEDDDVEVSTFVSGFTYSKFVSFLNEHLSQA